MPKRSYNPKPSTLTWANVQALKDPEIQSRALKVHRSQVAGANEAALSMGCGAPFRDDGTFVGRRSEVRRYVEEINRRRGEGEDRVVNFDGGYRDPM